LREIKFGPAGNPEIFYEQGGKSSLQMPEWVKNFGIDTYEYQCGRGVKISKDSAVELGENAKKHGITLSVHAPYFTNISSTEPEKIENTLRYILQTAEAAHYMGADRIVVHMGSPKGMTRREALDISKRTMYKALSMLEDNGFSSVTMCPETMGKMNQMGTLEEVLELCAMDERLVPTIDFGHLNSRMQGALTEASDFEKIILATQKKLGDYRAKNFHAHFSKIEYTTGGEKKHVTFDQSEWGPDFEPLAEVLVKYECTPEIICESAGTQAEDALKMKKIYERVAKNA